MKNLMKNLKLKVKARMVLGSIVGIVLIAKGCSMRKYAEEDKHTIPVLIRNIGIGIGALVVKDFLDINFKPEATNSIEPEIK